MAFFIDRWYGEPENLYYKGWIIEGREVPNSADFNVINDKFDFIVSVDNLTFDAIIGKRRANVVTADRFIDFDVIIDSFEFEVIRNAND